LINFLEILGYTAIIHFLGGIEATFLTPIYAALITYVGVMAPRGFTYVIAFLRSAAFSFVVGGESVYSRIRLSFRLLIFQGWLY
jgi:hypothetical protein